MDDYAEYEQVAGPSTHVNSALVTNKNRPTCVLCNKLFGRPSELIRHMGKVGNPTHQCPVVGRSATFYRADKWRDNIQQSHRDIAQNYQV